MRILDRFAWTLKNIFRDLWNCPSELMGGFFLTYWPEIVDKSN